MASLTPAQRRVLEAAQRGALERIGSFPDTTIRERSADGTGSHVVSGIAYRLIADELLTIDWDSEECLVRPTAAGRAELGITDTEGN